MLYKCSKECGNSTCIGREIYTQHIVGKKENVVERRYGRLNIFFLRHQSSKWQVASATRWRPGGRVVWWVDFTRHKNLKDWWLRHKKERSPTILRADSLMVEYRGNSRFSLVMRSLSPDEGKALILPSDPLRSVVNWI